MTDTAYDGASTPAAINVPKRKATKRKNMLRRFFDRLVEARMEQAYQEVARHAHLAPGDIRSQSGLNRASEEDGVPHA